MQTDFPNCEAISYRFHNSQAIDIFESGSSFLSSYHGNPILEDNLRPAAIEQSKLCTAPA